MKFKDFVLSKTEQEMDLEGNSILLHIMLTLSNEFTDEKIKEDFIKLIKKSIKQIGETEL